MMIKIKDMVKLHADMCMECGLCSYIVFKNRATEAVGKAKKVVKEVNKMVQERRFSVNSAND